MKSTKSRHSDSLGSRSTNWNWNFGWARGSGGALAPQLPRTITHTHTLTHARAGPKACGKKSWGLSIWGCIYPGVYLYRIRDSQIDKLPEFGPNFFSHPHFDLPCWRAAASARLAAAHPLEFVPKNSNFSIWEISGVFYFQKNLFSEETRIMTQTIQEFYKVQYY